MPKHCLSLICNPDVAEKLLDVLLTAYRTKYSPARPPSATARPWAPVGAEQVMGRSSSVQIS
jgi:hypothetical protein